MAVDKLNILLKQAQKLFHTNDLAVLWQVHNRNSLYTAISRYAQKGVLYPVQKGLYSTVPITELDVVQLGVHLLHRYAYLSTESVLTQVGIISQITYPTTFVSDISQKLKIGDNEYLVRMLQPKFLYNTSGIADRGDGVLVASVERAIADMRYFQPNYYFDNESQIDWEKVKQLQKEVGYL